jgi:polysaccharide pyruvyl transferase WcaK-like protein
MNDKVFLVGYYGWNNTGDDMMLYSLLSYLSKINKNFNYTILSNDPKLFLPKELEYDKIIYINEHNYFSILIQLILSDYIILGGGTHFYDYGRIINRIYRLHQFYIIFYISKLLNKKIYFIGIGIECFKTQYGKNILKKILQTSDYIVVRDSLSYDIVIKYGIKNIQLAKDLTYYIDIQKIINNKRKIVYNILGVSVLPFYKIYYKNKKIDNIFITKIAKSLNNWLKLNDKNRIYLFNIKGKSKDDDVQITKLLYSKIIDKKRVQIIPYYKNFFITISYMFGSGNVWTFS